MIAGWYEAGQRDDVLDRRLSPLRKRTPSDMRISEFPYNCLVNGRQGHAPLFGNRIRQGEKHMRADNCIYCGARIVSLHVGDVQEPLSMSQFDCWRTFDSVRPSMVIEEDPI